MRSIHYLNCITIAYMILFNERNNLNSQDSYRNAELKKPREQSLHILQIISNLQTFHE